MLARAILLVLYPLLHIGFSAESQDLANDYSDADVKNALPKFVYLTAPDKPPEEFLEDTEVATGETESKDIPIDRELLRLNPSYSAVGNESPELSTEAGSAPLTTIQPPPSNRIVDARNVTDSNVEEPIQLVHVKPLCDN
ncbi:hypothetical protein AAVH_08753 [Aphelenchoides avenae]|nr:hypothetical protein AAVH_36193 [Aphelenchus avenae]KAH7723647.1 hypothetical protein AAVH_08753 [Aphelenchus avenae]